MPPARRPQQLETVGQASLYPAVPVMRGGSYAAGHSPLAAHPPRSPMRASPMRARPAGTPSMAYSPAPKSGSMGSMGVGSPHVHWADFAFVREVSTIFDRQMALEMVPHTPEVVENPFRRRTRRQFMLDDATPPAMSASAGTLFSVAPMPHQAPAPVNHNMFAGFGTPVAEHAVAQHQPAYSTHYAQPSHIATSASAGHHHSGHASPQQRVQVQHRAGSSVRQSPQNSGTVQSVTTVQAYTPSAGAYSSQGRRNSLSSPRNASGSSQAYASSKASGYAFGRSSSGW